MPTQPTTRAQISGYNFLVRRMEHAIVRRDVRMMFDPMRSQSRAFWVGVILAVLGMAGMGVLALVKPQDKIGQNKILLGRDSGEMYVVLGDTIHPVLNLASAKLAVGDSAGEIKKPSVVKESELSKHPRGQLIGIPGAPSAMPHDADGNGRIWTVCDTIGSGGSTDVTTSVIVGDPVTGANTKKIGSGQAMLLKAANGQVYLAFDGKRAKLNLDNGAVTQALLSAENIAPRPVSDGLLNAIPEVPELVSPHIDGANPGERPEDAPYPMPEKVKVGAIVYTESGETKQYYVVMREGLQEVSPVVSDIIRNTNSHGMDAQKILPDMKIRAGKSTKLTEMLRDYPATTLTVDSASQTPVSCLSWKPLSTIADRKKNDTTAELSLLSGRELPVQHGTKPVPLIDQKAASIYITPSTGDFVQTTGIEPNSQRSDHLFYIDDRGVRFGIKDDVARKSLGLTESKPEPAPDAIVRLLAFGPVLGREEAMVAHDGLTPDPNATAVSAPSPGGSGGN